MSSWSHANKYFIRVFQQTFKSSCDFCFCIPVSHFTEMHWWMGTTKNVHCLHICKHGCFNTGRASGKSHCLDSEQMTRRRKHLSMPNKLYNGNIICGLITFQYVYLPGRDNKHASQDKTHGVEEWLPFEDHSSPYKALKIIQSRQSLQCDAGLFSRLFLGKEQKIEFVTLQTNKSAF